MELGGGDGENFDFFEGDFTKSSINGILVIAFFDRVQNYLLKDMKITMVVKLLGRNIAVETRVQPFSTFPNDCYGVDLSARPSRLSVQQKKILEEIGGLISKVAKLDFNTDNRLRGQFARMAIFELCLLSTRDRVALEVNEGLKESASTKGVSMGDSTEYGLWMVVERCSCQNSKEKHKSAKKFSMNVKGGIGLSKEDTYASGSSNMGPTSERKTTGNLGPGYGSWASPSNGSVAEAALLDSCAGGDLSNPDSGGSNPKILGSIGKGTAIGK
ncbi:hypothetical protein Golax_017585 [Gossypium laxum]|uniref:Uncharacterized protein n=1 Tax=Gossypium laxum TaxID=34288 RepID=A0A7J8Z0P0_9ROSI|nr:hypothetical protein [Gossypium laxum]